jgi:Zn-dependent M28 family amino/carboxypeptidase
MKKLFLVVLVVVSVVSSTSVSAQRKTEKSPKSEKAAAASSSPSRGNVDAITAAQMKDYLAFVASDEMEGRDTPSRGLDATAKFIATHLSRWGLKPAGDDGTYFQRIALRRNKIDPAQTRVEIGSQTFSYGDDFLAGLTAGTASGSLVYVAHGWIVKPKNVDPYQGLDVKDKIMIALPGFPKGVTNNDLTTGKQGVDWESPAGYAQKQGAKGIIFLPSFQTLANWNQARQNVTERGNVVVEKFINQNAPPLPTITASVRMVNALFQRETQNGNVIFTRAASGDAAEPFALSANKKVSMTVAVKSESLSTQNVVAVLEGADPTLKSEYVAVGAHYDHVGVGNPVNGDAIYNGADDDGSGTVAVLAMAEAFARGPRPKRSILLIWHAGEERGLWGSRYFTESPTVPINQIVAQLNIDMIGRCKKPDDTSQEHRNLPVENEVYLIGPKIMSTDMEQLSESVNRSFLNLKFNYKYDDAKHPEQFFFRSDHYNYARKGIPIIFYMDGDHEDYHRPSDSIEKINYEQMEKVTRTIFATAWELANAANRPRIDKPLAEN